MFRIGNYKVRFQHRHEGFVDFDGNPNEDICGETTCILLNNETDEVLSEFLFPVRKGECNSKNYRRKFSLATVLNGFFPTNGSNPHRAFWNKKARTLFWEAYAEKRGGLEDQLPKIEEEDEEVKCN
jgi:hypothetical protein